MKSINCGAHERDLVNCRACRIAYMKAYHRRRRLKWIAARYGPRLEVRKKRTMKEVETYGRVREPRPDDPGTGEGVHAAVRRAL